MWVRKTESQQDAIYLSSMGNDEISVYNIATKQKEVWLNKDIEVLLDRSSDYDDMAVLLREIILRRGERAFDEEELFKTSKAAMLFYIEDSAFASENEAALEDNELLHQVIRRRINTLQEVLYFALGDKHDVGETRDKTLMFIHNTLPNLMEGFYLGFVAKQMSLCKCLDSELSQGTDSDKKSDLNPEEKVIKKVRTRRGWCSIFC